MGTLIDMLTGNVLVIQDDRPCLVSELGVPAAGRRRFVRDALNPSLGVMTADGKIAPVPVEGGGDSVMPVWASGDGWFYG